MRILISLLLIIVFAFSLAADDRLSIVPISNELIVGTITTPNTNFPILGESIESSNGNAESVFRFMRNANANHLFTITDCWANSKQMGIPITTIVPLTNVVAILVQKLHAPEYSIEVTDRMNIENIHFFFEGGCPINELTPRLGTADYLITFKRNDGSSTGAAIWRSNWEGNGGFVGNMKDGWESFIADFIASKQNEKKNAQPSAAGNGVSH